MAASYPVLGQTMQVAPVPQAGPAPLRRSGLRQDAEVGAPHLVVEEVFPGVVVAGLSRLSYFVSDCPLIVTSS